ncbi:MAG: hypothetical protein HON53_09525 [Planctomycetaceae bacterium]|jgi:hypothetical protein|nr:hypothetical protein [Planctomycetaceae bacterium]MBT6153444.1 hypothetical protein [Planctomycetaceae bacterium]MBT6484724.1 hypothetical protein [Planctomycetaceae bacterium]MBT6496474.1 hypothetical protein [Planctomycetaceae bacterium]
MNLFSPLKSLFSSLLFAVGQVFAWLNRRDSQKEDNESKDRVAENMRAAAKPNQENADRLNRWLSRGRSGRLRDRRK